MSTYRENLETARNRIAVILADLVENPKPDYSVGGVSMSWSAYFNQLTGNLEALNKAIQQADSPFWRVSKARS